MKHSVKEELREFGINYLVDLQLEENQLRDHADVHNMIFNMDYYIIGYHEANEWLKQHRIDVFDGMEYVREKEDEYFGEAISKLENSEALVNHMVYFVGMDLIDEIIEDYKNNFLNN